MQKFKTSIQSTSTNLRQNNVKSSIYRCETKWGKASTRNNGQSKHQTNNHHHILGNANDKNQNYTNETDIG